MNSEIQSFEDLIVWQEARKLTQKIYFLLKDSKDCGFRDQIQRASVSIMNNLAEGFERPMLAEKLQFYRYAKGSAGEVRSMLYVGLDNGTFSQETFDDLFSQAQNISRGISNLIQSLEKYRK